MLRLHYEASRLVHLAMRKHATNMTSSDGTADLAVRAMTTAFTTLNRSQSKQWPLSSGISTKPSRTWNPHHGIKFSATTALSPSASRSMYTDSPAAVLSTSDSSKSPLDSITEVTTTAGVAEDDSHTPLKFKVSQKLFEETQKAHPSKRYWSYALYRGPDGPDHKVKVHYCRSKDTSEKVAQYFLNSDVIGFDIEWKVDSYKYSGAKQNVSLIQIANDEKVALFHVALFAKDGINDLVPPTLKKIMEDPKIIKVGVAIKGDCTRLRKHLNINSKGVLELSNLYKLTKYSASGEYEKINKRLVNLASQVEEHLKLPLFKGDEVRGSDWTQPLDLEQLAYAASDSYAGLRLFDVMETRRKELKPTPPRPYFSEQELPIRLADGVALQSGDDETEDTEPPSAATEGRLTVDGTSIEFESDSTSLPTSAKTVSKTTRKKEVTKAPEIIQAELWVIEWKSSKSGVSAKATPASLRAYALWQHQDLSVEAISSLLAIQNSTVATYIAEAIKSEKLPFEQEKLEKVFTYMPESVAIKRYRTLLARLRKSTSV